MQLFSKYSASSHSRLLACNFLSSVVQFAGRARVLLQEARVRARMHANASRVERGGDASAAWLTSFGHRPQQQDVALVSPPVYGIFDGHGPDGLLTAQRAARLLTEYFAADQNPALSSEERVRRVFARTQTTLLEVRHLLDCACANSLASTPSARTLRMALQQRWLSGSLLLLMASLMHLT